jgi:tetratricopeptide (TPR) repeat protein
MIERVRFYNLSWLALCLGLAMTAHSAFSQQPDALKASADSAFIASDFERAAETYELALAQGFVSAEMHYNLGNAYFKSGQVARSILNYERAHRLAPQDEDIAFNLKLARLSTKDRIETMPELFFITWWNALLQALPMDGWAWSAVVSLMLVLVGLSIFRFSASVGLRQAMFYTALLVGLWGVFSGYAAQRQYRRMMDDDRAVVMRPTVNVKSAPEQTGKDLFAVHEGLVVQVTETIGTWYRIRLADGNVGWVPQEAVEGI